MGAEEGPGLGYDADSNLTSVTTPSTGTITYAYDVLGQRTSASYSDSTATVSYTYDADGDRASMTDGTGTTNYTYDNRDRLTQTAHGSDTFAYTYDAGLGGSGDLNWGVPLADG